MLRRYQRSCIPRLGVVALTVHLRHRSLSLGDRRSDHRARPPTSEQPERHCPLVLRIGSSSVYVMAIRVRSLLDEQRPTGPGEADSVQAVQAGCSQIRAARRGLRRLRDDRSVRVMMVERTESRRGRTERLSKAGTEWPHGRLENVRGNLAVQSVDVDEGRAECDRLGGIGVAEQVDMARGPRALSKAVGGVRGSKHVQSSKHVPVPAT